MVLVILVPLSLLLIWLATDGRVWAGDIKNEVARDAVQLLLVTLVGVALAALLDAREKRNEDARRDYESQLRLTREVTVAYNRIKAVRRTLKALGADLSVAPVPPFRQLSEAESAEFFTQMQQLSESQLALESGKREARVRAGAYWNLGDSGSGRTYDRLTKHLEAMESYVNAIVSDWEERPDKAEPLDAIALFRMRRLQLFLGPPNVQGGVRGPGPDQQGLSARLREIETLLRDRRHGEQPAVKEYDLEDGTDGPHPARRSSTASRP